MSGGLLVVTFTDILPEPILSYWSLKVILELIVSPDAVPEPLNKNPVVNSPLLFTAIWELEEVNDWTVGLPYDGE